MPFTLVHPAAVVWWPRGPLNLLALVCGSLAPDLPYYLRTARLPVTADSWYEPYVNATSSHSLDQFVTVALPLALVAYVLGCLLVPPLCSVAGIARTSPPTTGLTGTVKHSAWVVASLTIGVLSHLAWDALTEVGSASRLLQYGSTAVGLFVLTVVLLRRRTLIRWRDQAVRRGLVATSAALLLSALVGALLASRGWFSPPPGFSSRDIIEGALSDGVKGASVAVAVAGVALSLAWWAKRLTAAGGNGERA